MLPFPRFEFHQPQTLSEALALKQEAQSLFIAGGTDLSPSMKHRLFTPAHLISLQGIDGLQSISVRNQQLYIGAMMRLIEIQRHPLIQEHFSVLAFALSQIGTHTIQHMGTIGGNIMLDTRCLYYNQPEGWRQSIQGCLKADGQVCHVAPKGKGCYAAHSADSVPLLWLLDAQLQFETLTGPRSIPLKDLYGSDGRTWLDQAKDLILTQIVIPLPKTKLAHRKVRLRASIDYAQLLVAVQKHGEHAQAVISAVGPQPIFVEAPLNELAEAAYRSVQPLKTHAPNPAWRKHMVRIEVQRALDSLQ